mmetsp:Transcript_17655/g.46959  ORF Transcript_17655/g.46959 Transcript_17655/m.46959 type:complete len:171 (-) Transcript_17655:8-520(-)
MSKYKRKEDRHAAIVKRARILERCAKYCDWLEELHKSDNPISPGRLLPVLGHTKFLHFYGRFALLIVNKALLNVFSLYCENLASNADMQGVLVTGKYEKDSTRQYIRKVLHIFFGLNFPAFGSSTTKKNSGIARSSVFRAYEIVARGTALIAEAFAAVKRRGAPRGWRSS